MAKTKVLISVKTYPTLSSKYDELVCTAGFLEDGTWIRIYPVPFRKLEKDDRYEKWRWIEIDLVKNESDFRPESFRPANIDNQIELLDRVDTGKDSKWAARKEIALKNVYYDMSVLIDEAKDRDICTSLAVIKPKEIIDFIWEPCEREWDKRKLDKVYANQAQGSLFDVEETKQFFNVVQKIPYKFSYVFTTEDGKTRTLMIEDWELGALYWNCLRTHKNEQIACEKVKQKYFDNFAMKKDLHFFMGTTRLFHSMAPNPFIIVGVFYPPKVYNRQLSLF